MMGEPPVDGNTHLKVTVSAVTSVVTLVGLSGLYAARIVVTSELAL